MRYLKDFQLFESAGNVDAIIAKKELTIQDLQDILDILIAMNDWDKAYAKAKELVAAHPKLPTTDEFYITTWKNQFFKHYMNSPGFKEHKKVVDKPSLYSERASTMKEIEILTARLARIDAELDKAEAEAGE